MKSLRAKILAGFSSMLVIIILLASISIYNIEKTNNIVEELITDDLVELDTYQVLSFNLAERLAVVRGYLLYGDSEMKEKFYEFTKESQMLEQQLVETSSEEELAENEALAKASKVWAELVDQRVIALYDQGQKEKAVQQLRSEAKLIGEELIEQIKQLKLKNQQEVDELGTTIMENGVFLEKLILVLSISAVLLGIIISVFVANMIVKPILRVVHRLNAISGGDFSGDDLQLRSKDEVGQLVTALNRMNQNVKLLIRQVSETSEQVAASSQQLTASAEQTSQATEQISTSIQEVATGSERQVLGAKSATESIEEISTSMKNVSKSSDIVADLTVNATEKSNAGALVVKQTVEQMNQLHSQVSETEQAVNSLGEKSSEIGKIVSLITDIANQTNLLALNAAIEAARAGEHGKGFAVVADEVRKLAEQSGRAAGEISTLINEMQSGTDLAVTSMGEGKHAVIESMNKVNETGETFKDIVSMIEKIREQSGQVSNAVKLASEKSNDMVAVIENVAQISEQSSSNTQNVAASAQEQLASMEEITSSAESLSHLSLELQEMLKKFRTS